ncbi:MAG: IS200/IS605 family transposase, partial [Calditrichia bacterium]
MANTYSQIYIHVIFTVQGRQNLIPEELKEELHKYITGIIKNKKQKLICINSMPDHIHIFIGLEPGIALSDLGRDIKNNSSTFIGEKKGLQGKFNWQEGFGAFSYGYSQIAAVVKYIQNQEKH